MMTGTATVEVTSIETLGLVMNTGTEIGISVEMVQTRTGTEEGDAEVAAEAGVLVPETLSMLVTWIQSSLPSGHGRNSVAIATMARKALINLTVTVIEGVA